MPDEVGHQRGLLGDALQCARRFSASCRVSISSDRQLLRMLPRRQVFCRRQRAQVGDRRVLRRWHSRRNTPVVELGHDPQQQSADEQRIAGDRQHHRVLGRGHGVLAVSGLTGRHGERSRAPGRRANCRHCQALSPAASGVRVSHATRASGASGPPNSVWMSIGRRSSPQSASVLSARRQGESSGNSMARPGSNSSTGQERQQPPARMPPRTRWLQVQRRTWNFHVEIERQALLPAETIRAGRHPREGEQRQLEGVDRFCGWRAGPVSAASWVARLSTGGTASVDRSSGSAGTR